MSHKMVQPLVQAPGFPHDPFLAGSGMRSPRRRRIERLAFLLGELGLTAGVIAWLRTEPGIAWLKDVAPLASFLGVTVWTIVRWCTEGLGIMLVVVMISWAVVRVVDTFTDDFALKVAKAIANELRDRDCD